jgi:hypothetical protein
VIGRLRAWAERRAAKPAMVPRNERAPDLPPHRRDGRRGRRRADRLDRRRGAAGRPAGAGHVHPRRRPAHRRHHLLHRAVAGDACHARRAPSRLRPRPRAGDVDVVVATELVEAGRCCERGFVSPTAPCWSPRSAASSRPRRNPRWAMAASTRNA